MTTRKQVSDTLLARLQATGAFVLTMTGKRNRDPESIPTNQTPACFVVKHSETNRRPSSSLPNIRTLHLRIVIYTDAGGDENIVPSDAIDALLEHVDAVLAPDDPVSGRCTLGKLVHSAMIQGDTVHAPGDVTGKGLAIIPVEVIMP